MSVFKSTQSYSWRGNAGPYQLNPSAHNDWVSCTLCSQAAKSIWRIKPNAERGKLCAKALQSAPLAVTWAQHRQNQKYVCVFTLFAVISHKQTDNSSQKFNDRDSMVRFPECKLGLHSPHVFKHHLQYGRQTGKPAGKPLQQFGQCRQVTTTKYCRKKTWFIQDKIGHNFESIAKAST